MDKISDWGRGNAPLQAQINTTPLPPEANILKKKTQMYSVPQSGFSPGMTEACWCDLVSYGLVMFVWYFHYSVGKLLDGDGGRFLCMNM